MIGWLGSILLAWCGFPQMLLSIKTKHAKGISWSFLLMWLSGEILTLVYIYTNIQKTPLLFNYISNILFLGVIIYYKIIGG